MGEILILVVLEEIVELGLRVVGRDDQGPRDLDLTLRDADGLVRPQSRQHQKIRQIGRAEREQRVVNRPRDLDRFPSGSEPTLVAKPIERKHGGDSTEHRSYEWTKHRPNTMTS